ncbi:hypothetical protein EZ428_00185 [Pedobacter frigiditerrae]|uniref:HPt domain-containing protein n=1 Tax=Pedobacter frigiditerrae TaxID=2530452 RepID=A0A4R0N0P8_9SPHI|nr:hypothetical protein [Pedobacter frigiditerrae]TCC93230.1 hypothetical protein EZ428_00185 [Pedobacter frigiditerrae]
MKEQPEFKLINLSYMQEISLGDLEYEKKVTTLFIEIIPENLVDLETYFELKSFENLKKTLHHMQSSISIMGLDDKLSKYMDFEAYENANEKEIKEKMDFITTICIQAIAEAKDYLKNLG